MRAFKADGEMRAFALSSGAGHHAVVFDEDGFAQLLRAAIEREGSQVAFAKHYAASRSHMNRFRWPRFTKKCAHFVHNYQAVGRVRSKSKNSLRQQYSARSKIGFVTLDKHQNSKTSVVRAIGT